MYLPKPTEGGDFAPAPAGTFTASCYRFIDLGTHVSEFNGDKKTRHEVMISWEIADEFMEDGRPFTINKRYTWSMHEKSTLRQHLEAWRKKPFVEEDFEGPNAFDIRNILGKPCTLTIRHEQKQDGKTISKVAAVGPVMRGLTAPPIVNKQVYLALDPQEFDAAAFGELSDYYKTLIAESPEYKDIMQKSRQHDDPGSAPYGGEGFNDDVPFAAEWR